MAARRTGPARKGSMLVKRTLVHYRVKPETTQDNVRLIENVFAQLRTSAPQGVRYLVLQRGDGTFMHFSAVDTPDGTNPILQLEAFRAYRAGIEERCLDQPQSGPATVVGNYRMLDE
jgi:hypothetical protein